MPNQKHWTANSPHRKPSKNRNRTVELDEVDVPSSMTGPCDGDEAGRMLGLYGTASVERICERVAKYGGRPT